MSSAIPYEDLRSIKTKKALYAAMFSLLKNYSFRKITIKQICEEAYISRAAFYTHFIDKYDLLKHWAPKLWPKCFPLDSYEQMEKSVNRYVRENMVTLKNLFCDADNETLEILFDYILSVMNLSAEKTDTEKTRAKNIVLTRFCGGGILYYLFWQVENNFPADVPLMNRYLYEIISEFQEWQSH